MKHYTHKPVELKKLTTQTINFKRFYETPDGNLYPSITTVLSTRNKKGLFEPDVEEGVGTKQIINHNKIR